MLCAQVFVVLAASVGAGEAQRPPPPFFRGPAVRAEDLSPPEACKPCHPQHYEEWRGSMHAYAISDPVFHAMHRLGQEETGGALADFCVRCHAPIGTATGEVGAATRSESGLSPPALAGVSCEVCHRAPRLEHAAGERPHNASFSIDPRAPLVGGIPNPVENNFHASRTDDSLKSPDFCGACHNVSSHRGVPVEKPHEEYAASVYPRRDVACINCHMQTYTGRATPDGPIRNQLHRHDFVGVDVALTTFPRRGFQEREVEAFLRTAARVSVAAPRRVEAGKAFSFEVRVKNVGAGHNLPTGPSTEREMWLEVAVERPDGAPVLRSGYLDENGDLMNEHSEVAPRADPQLALFTDRFVDERGEEVYFMWRAHRLEEGTIPPLETRTATYRAIAPADAAGERLALRVRLRFRAFPPHQLRRLGIGELAARFPIFDLQEVEADPIEVVETLRLPGVIRVPGDAASLEEAFREAQSGDTILLAAGRHLVSDPLDFAGRALRLRAASAPARTPDDTVIELAGEPADPDRAALLVFESGEGPDALVEGVTLRGGRGIALEGGALRAGGAILAVDSSPTISGCVFADNRAEDGRGGGLGGAVFLRRSSALLLENRFEGNRADGRGGAVCALDGSQAVLEGNLFLANLAPEGGAVALEAGNHLAGNRLRLNRAFRGGAVLVHGGADAVGSQDGPPVALWRNDITANTAAAGGAVLVAGPLRAQLERSVLAGNIGGALRAEGGADVEVIHSTVVDNRLGSAAIELEEGSRVRVRGSIVWGNRPSRIGAEVVWSLVDDEAHVSGTNRAGLPLFRQPFAEWERCLGPGENCIPIVRFEAARSARGLLDPSALEPEDPGLYRRYRAGRSALLDTSPAIDAAEPAGPPDPDGTRADIGAEPRLRGGSLFVRGDLDGDGEVGASDAALLRALLAPAGGGEATGEPALECAEAADVDGDGLLTPADLARLVQHLAGEAPPPPHPFPECGADPQLLSSLGCFANRCKP